MVHYNLNNKHYQKSKNLTPEQFKEIYKANNPLEFCLTQIFKKEINELAQMEMVIKEDKKKFEEEKLKDFDYVVEYNFDEYVSPFEPIFIMMKKSLQKKVDDYIAEMEQKKKSYLNKIKSK